MFAQLGTTVFDGLKSFVSFSDDEDAIIVEHALIGRKAKLQGTAIGLRNINITLFLHQEFCKVSDEILKLRNSKNTFEVLPLLWGNGQLEGEFVIVAMSRSNSQMDSLGNTISATVSIILKENSVDDKINQQQQQAQANAFAVGDKKPPTKSNRVNPQTCNKQTSNAISYIKSNGTTVDSHCRKYTNDPIINMRLKSSLTGIISYAQNLVVASSNPSSCVYGIKGLGTNASNVKTKATSMLGHVQSNMDGYVTVIFIPNISGVKADNDILQIAIKSLTASANSILKSTIINK